MPTFIDTVIEAARKAGYPDRVIEAGVEYYKRKNRLSHPRGRTGSCRRFYCSEHTSVIASTRDPSVAYPFSHMLAARGYPHVTELYGLADEQSVYVRRVCKAIESGAADAGNLSAHELMTRIVGIKKTLKTYKECVAA